MPFCARLVRFFCVCDKITHVMANLINWRGQVNFSSGDTIRVHQTVTEGNKTRTQIFEGLVIRIRGHQGLKSFTVRKLSYGIGVEKIFPESTPTVTKIEVTKKGDVRRAVLSYLRKRVGKKATKVKDKFVKGVKDLEQEVVTKSDSEDLTEEARQSAKLARLAAEEKATKAASKAEKAIKKSKKKAKIVRKERTFVR